jgi:hypothetical protein
LQHTSVGPQSMLSSHTAICSTLRLAFDVQTSNGSDFSVRFAQ